MSDEIKYADELHDRLMDRALQEVLGGEAPPDLTEQILGAVSAAELSTPATGVGAMNPEQSRSGHSWLTAAVAASILAVLGSLMFLGSRDSLRQVSVIIPSADEQTLDNKKDALSTEIILGVRPQIIIEAESLDSADTLDGQDFDSTSFSSTVQVPDGGTVLLRGRKRLSEFRDKNAPVAAPAMPGRANDLGVRRQYERSLPQGVDTSPQTDEWNSVTGRAKNLDLLSDDLNTPDQPSLFDHAIPAIEQMQKKTETGT